MVELEPRVEVAKFKDGRLKVLLRCKEGKNFWNEGNGEYTWCPELDTPTILVETLEAIDEYNNRKMKKKVKQLYNSTFLP